MPAWRVDGVVRDIVAVDEVQALAIAGGKLYAVALGTAWSRCRRRSRKGCRPRSFTPADVCSRTERGAVTGGLVDRAGDDPVAHMVTAWPLPAVLWARLDGVREHGAQVGASVATEKPAAATRCRGKAMASTLGDVLGPDPGDDDLGE